MKENPKHAESPGSLGWFFFFILVNLALSYLSLRWIWKLPLCLFGIVLPWAYLALRPRTDRSSSRGLPEGWLPFPSTPVWWTLLFAGFLLRWFGPAGLHPWPVFDEAINGYYALRLDQHWSWRPFFFFSQLPPFFIWGLHLLHQLLGSLLSAIRWEPFLISFLTLPAAYGAARAFLDRSSSLLYSLFLALGFWPLFFSGISHQAVMLILWEYLALGLLGGLLKASGPARTRWLLGLGLCLGSGFYTYFAWPLVAFWIGILALLDIVRQKKDRDREFLWLCLPLLAVLLPLGLAAWGNGYGGYYRLLFSLKSGNDWGRQLDTTLNFLFSILWGNRNPNFTYGPVWGGFFDPVLASAVLWGLLDLFRRREEGLSKALGFGLFLFLIPAFLTNTLTFVRIIPVLPLLTYAGVRGFTVLFQGKRMSWALGLLLAASTALGLVHGVKAQAFIQQGQEAQKTVELEKAYQALRDQKGPGWVLTSFSNDLYTYDRSLSVACYPFNLAQNPRLDPASGQWTAVVANIHLRPFLEKRFPGASFQWLSDKDHAARDDYNGGLMLVLIPGPPGPEIRTWIDWDRQVRTISDAAMELPVAQARRKALADLEEAFPALPKDPFLRSCYWEMIYTGYSWETHYGDGNVRENFPRTMAALQAGIAQGYPTAYFLNELGTCWAMVGDRAKAKEYLQKAVHAPLDLTPAAENLKAMAGTPK